MRNNEHKVIFKIRIHDINKAERHFIARVELGDHRFRVGMNIECDKMLTA